MRLFISSDIEGTAGITHWDETDYDRGGRWYDYFREQMTREVAAACTGAKAGGAEYIRVKDAHDWARNIIPTELPEGVTIHRGWSGSPFSMVDGLEEGFDALAFTGYHSPAYSDGNPLSHTMTTIADEVRINGARASEFIIHGYIAAMLKIPVIFLSGDAALCESAKAFVPGIITAATNIGKGAAVTSLHPADAAGLIRDGVRAAVEKGGKDCVIELPEHFETTIKYQDHRKAYKFSFYQGVKLIDEKTLRFESDDYMDVLRFYHFVL
jgi:D-amino peptidase